MNRAAFLILVCQHQHVYLGVRPPGERWNVKLLRVGGPFCCTAGLQTLVDWEITDDLRAAFAELGGALEHRPCKVCDGEYCAACGRSDCAEARAAFDPDRDGAEGA